MNSKKRTGRLAGLLYFLFIATFILSTVVRGKLVVLTDASKTAANISAHEWLFQFSIVTELISLFLFFAAAWALYSLLKPTKSHLALLFLLLNSIGVAIECMSTITLFAVSLVARGDLKMLGSAEQNDVTIFLIQLYQNGFMIAQLFFSTWLLPLGYLVFKCGFLPKVLGVLLMLDFFFWFLYFIQYFLFPNFKELAYVSFPVAIAAEFSLTLWLLIKGAKENGSAAV